MNLIKVLDVYKVFQKDSNYNLVDISGGKYDVPDIGWKKVMRAMVEDKDQKLFSLSQPITPCNMFAFYLDIDHNISHNNLQAVISYFEGNFGFHVICDKSSTCNNYHMFFRNKNGEKIVVNKTKARQIVDGLLKSHED